MEVHHPHHPTHKKKWSEYIVEFIMLFAAVSLGFLAENIREQYIEKERAHELVESFINDVEANVIFLDSLLLMNHNAVLKNDSSLLYLMESEQVELDSFFNFLPVSSYRYLNNNDTYDQMKSSGSLRYIKDTVLLRKIITYNNTSKAAEFRSVTQEFEYVSHEYTEAIQKWMPGEIAIKRHVQPYFNGSFRDLMRSEKQKVLMSRLNSFSDNKDFTISGERLKQMKKELIPTISRKAFLMSASQRFMSNTLVLAKDLLEYYKKQNH
ncbi:MAG: hypothetical protein RL634_1129 [Bacteroidota bacterium]|jgi:hypothetical protein|nr:hypothetical protein [Chitinophagia bacterium]